MMRTQSRFSSHKKRRFDLYQADGTAITSLPSVMGMPCAGNAISLGIKPVRQATILRCSGLRQPLAKATHVDIAAADDHPDAQA